MDRKTGRQAERRIGRQEDRQTGRQADRQTGRQADRETDRKTGRQTGRQADRQTGFHIISAHRCTGNGRRAIGPIAVESFIPSPAMEAFNAKDRCPRAKIGFITRTRT